MLPKVLIALPCFNEELSLGGLLDTFVRLREVYGMLFDAHVVVVDDGSSDGTLSVAEAYACRLPLEIVRHPSNLGLHEALKSSFRAFYRDAASERPAVAYGLMDGDNSHNPLQLPRMLERLHGGHDVVVASRFREGSRTVGVAPHRQALSLGMAALFKAFRNIPGVRDYSCGFRVYSPRIVRELEQRHGDAIVTERNFSCMVELLVNCHKAGALMAEVPMTLRYDLKKSASKMRVLRTVAGTMRVLAR
jgi:dolichol-phosphate mannosyltransferase